MQKTLNEIFFSDLLKKKKKKSEEQQLPSTKLAVIKVTIESGFLKR
jgi:hypothetical protein